MAKGLAVKEAKGQPDAAAYAARRRLAAPDTPIPAAPTMAVHSAGRGVRFNDAEVLEEVRAVAARGGERDSARGSWSALKARLAEGGPTLDGAPQTPPCPAFCPRVSS